MKTQTIRIEGQSYVLVKREDYDRLATLAKVGATPPLPDKDADGHYPAVEYARASLARKIIRERVAIGLNQKQLAKAAGIRIETLNRIETGKATPTLPTVQKIEKVLQGRKAKG